MKRLLTALGLTAMLASSSYADQRVQAYVGGNGDNIALGGVEAKIGELYGAEFEIGMSGLHDGSGSDDVLLDFQVGRPFGESFRITPTVGASGSVAHYDTGGYSNINLGVEADYGVFSWLELGGFARYHQTLGDEDSFVSGGLKLTLSK